MKAVLIPSLLAAFLYSPLIAEESPSLADLDQRLKIAERKLEGVSAGPGGFVISSADKKYALKLGGLLQADSRNYLEDQRTPLSNDILVRRARLINQATLGGKLKLNLVVELAGAAPSLIDAFADIKAHDWISVKVGRFKTPISLENFRSDPARDFIEAGFSLGLATTRDNGLWVEVADPDQALSLGAGVFDGGLDGATVAGDSHDDKDAVGKIFIHPARLFGSLGFRDYGFGVAASSGHRSPGSPTASYRSSGQQSVTSYKALTTVQNQSSRIAPQAYLFHGPFSLLAEYIRSSDFASNSTNAAEYQSGILGREAWQVSAGWVVSGEDASFGGVKWNPDTTDHFGIVQIVARYQEFRIDGPNAPAFVNPRSSVTQIQGLGLGLNWIPLPNVKTYLNLDQNTFTDGSAFDVNREREIALFARAQYSY